MRVVAKKQPPQQPPPVQRLRLRYTKRGVMRFASNRDFSRALERALRRAGIPMAYSSGFTPHPRISYAGAAPTGASSEAEYVEIGLSTRCDPGEVARLIDQNLPEGFAIVQVAEAQGSRLASRLEASAWTLDFVDIDPGEVGVAVAAVLAAERVEVSRMTKNGERIFDVRAAIVSMTADQQRVRVVLRQGEPLVRPDDICRALTKQPGLSRLMGPMTIIRMNRESQGRLAPDGSILDPLLDE